MHTHCHIECCLSAHGWENGIHLLFLDDLGNDLFGDRFDIGAVGKLRIGHDRCRVGVDEYNPVSELFEGFGSLCTGVVKFTGLSDNDGP